MAPVAVAVDMVAEVTSRISSSQVVASRAATTTGWMATTECHFDPAFLRARQAGSEAIVSGRTSPMAT
jgi:hypothetical protein